MVVALKHTAFLFIYMIYHPVDGNPLAGEMLRECLVAQEAHVQQLTLQYMALFAVAG